MTLGPKSEGYWEDEMLQAYKKLVHSLAFNKHLVHVSYCHSLWAHAAWANSYMSLTGPNLKWPIGGTWGDGLLGAIGKADTIMGFS